MLLNQTFPDSRIKVRITVGVAHGSDVDQVKRLLAATAAEVEGVLIDPAPEAYFASFGDSALNMALYFWVGDYEELIAVTDKINSRILKCFAENSIEIPYPTRTLKMGKGTDRNGQQD
jgi:small-conductance mechanosensitive channel